MNAKVDARRASPPSIPSIVERVLGDATFSVDEFVEIFPILVEAEGGSIHLKQLVLDLAAWGFLARSGNEFAPIGGSARPDILHVGPHALPPNWVWIPIECAFNSVSAQGKKVLTSSVKETGKYPVVDQGQVLVRGFSDNEASVIRLVKAVIVFGDHTRQVKYVDFDFVPGADGTKNLLPNEDVDPRYFYWIVKGYRLESRGYGRHYGRLLEHSFPLPPLAEQKRIVAQVEQLMKLCDELEAKLRRAEDRASKLVEAVVQEMVG